MAFQNIQQVEQFLNEIPSFKDTGSEGLELGLESMKAFCSRIGDPQKRINFIHVAGTNGKGTTCRYLSSVYHEAGYRCGMFTSPHLLDIKERFVIGDQQIPTRDILRFFNQYHSLLQETNLSYFEILTGLAFWWFDDQQVELAVIETGLGGRLDATNIVDPLISVITSVGLDHQDILGDTIAEISREKAGIIKPRRPVVIGNLARKAQNVVRDVALQKESPVYESAELNPRFSDGQFILDIDENPAYFDSGFAAPINARNIAITWMIIKVLEDRYPVQMGGFRHGIKDVVRKYPRTGCFEQLNPSLNWYFDGAHNFESLKALQDTLQNYRKVEDWNLVFCLMRDKITPSLVNTFSDFKKKYYYSLNSKRAATFEEVSKYMKNLLPFPAKLDSQRKILNQLKSEFVIFTGSLYFYDSVRKWVDASVSENN